MDAFEDVVASILRRQGYWTMTSVRVELTKAEKRAIDRPAAPRWELDVVAYRGITNELRVVECKSFLDSPGVECAVFAGKNVAGASRYKLFFDATLRRVVLRRLERQLEAAGMVRRQPKLTLCLAAGKIRGDESWLSSHFKKKGWVLLGPEWIRDGLKALRGSGYENTVAAVVAKLLLREGKRARIRDAAR